MFVLGAEASPGLTTLVRGLPPAAGVEPLRLGLPMIEAMPFVPWRRFARSDYHGLREHLRRPFLFVTTGRTETYHTARDTPETLDYAKLGRLTRWVALLAVHAADRDGDLGWGDLVADARADARTLLRLHEGLGDGSRLSWFLRRTLAADRRRIELLLRTWEGGTSPTAADYRALQLASMRLQAALWRPSGWWFALW